MKCICGTNTLPKYIDSMYNQFTHKIFLFLGEKEGGGGGCFVLRQSFDIQVYIFQQQDIVTSNRKSGLICMTASTRNRTLGWRAGSRPSTPTGPRTPRQTLKRSAPRFLRRLGGPGMTSYVSCQLPWCASGIFNETCN